jgi:hypothetical protein
MHVGPTIAVSSLRWLKGPHELKFYQYLGELPTPNTKPTDVSFFKIYEKGYDAQKGRDVNFNN